MDESFRIDGLDIIYPVHVTAYGTRWNFYSEYLKRLRSAEVEKDTPHTVMDTLIDLGVFSSKGINVVKNVPLIITKDVRISNDRRYYMVDYMIPEYNMVIILTNPFKKSLNGKSLDIMKKTISKIGYDVIELDLNQKPNSYDKMINLLKGFLASFDFRTVPDKKVIPNYEGI